MSAKAGFGKEEAGRAFPYSRARGQPCTAALRLVLTEPMAMGLCNAI